MDIMKRYKIEMNQITIKHRLFGSMIMEVCGDI